MVIRTLSFLILLIVMVSCGARDHHRSEILLSGQVHSGMPMAYMSKSGEGLIPTLTRQDMFLDTDKDKIRDRDDFDIDNDGVPNDCDIAPFDSTLGSADADADKIPDFCDQDDEVQDLVFKKYGILMNINEQDILHYDKEEIQKLLKYIASKAALPNAELLTLTLTDGLPQGEFGVYDGKWKSIRYRTDDSYHEEFSEILNSSWVLVHEFFHFVAAANKVQLKGNPEFYPTKYSRVSKEEYYAELEAFNYFFPQLNEQNHLPHGTDLSAIR